MLESNNAHFKRKMLISNEQLKKLLADNDKNIIPVIRNNIVSIPIKNFSNIGISTVSIPFQNYEVQLIELQRLIILKMLIFYLMMNWSVK